MKLPKHIYVFLTENCNMNCYHCYGNFSKFRKREDLCFEQWTQIFDQCFLNKIFYFTISGGEPTVHPHFTSLIDYLVKNNQYFSLVTNGLFHEGIENFLMRRKDHIIEIKISIDGFDFETYDYIRNIRREQIFKNLLQRVNHFIENDIKVIFGINIHGKTINRIQEFCVFLNGINPFGIEISIITDTGRAKEMPYNDKFFHITWIEKLKNEFKKNLNNDIHLVFSDMPFNSEAAATFGYSCPAMEDFFTIDAFGMLLPCPLFNDTILKDQFQFPNVLEQGLAGAIGTDLFAWLLSCKKKSCCHDDRACVNFVNCDRCIAQSFLKGEVYSAPDFCLQYETDFFKNQGKIPG